MAKWTGWVPMVQRVDQVVAARGHKQVVKVVEQVVKVDQEVRGAGEAWEAGEDREVWEEEVDQEA